jgi:hypothetical protein
LKFFAITYESEQRKNSGSKNQKLDKRLPKRGPWRVDIRNPDFIRIARSNYNGTVNAALSVVSTIVPRGILTLEPLVRIDAPTPTRAPVRAPELPPIRPPTAAALAVRPTVLLPSPPVCAESPLVEIGNN